ncbi:MAG: MFS transporter [Rudaea sp.]|nr:MFS transporter [Rudaea sp.]
MAEWANALGTLRQSLSLLRTRRFGTFWFASLLSNIGTWAQQVVQPWLLLSLGASPFLLGLDEFAMDAPVWVLTLIGGVLADRADRRRVITLCQSIQMLCPTLIVVLLLIPVLQPWMIIALSLIIGITDALSMPSFQTIVPSIVKRGQISSGLALNSTQFNLSRILGPALAGLLITGMGVIACYVASALSYLPFILIALWILPRQSPAPVAKDAIAIRQLFTGVRGIVGNRPIRGALLTVLATGVLCGPLVTFCPVLVKTGFDGNAAQFSAAIGAFGLGGLLGAMGLLSVDEGSDRRRLSTWFAATYGFIVMLAALTQWFWSLPLLLLLAGLSMNVSNTSANTVLLTTADSHLRGQTVSLYMLAMRGGLALGGLLTGLTVSLLGVRQALLINGVLALAIHIVIGRQWLGSLGHKPLP